MDLLLIARPSLLLDFSAQEHLWAGEVTAANAAELV